MKLEGFFQNAYVTRDLEYAIAQMQAKHGIEEFIRIEPQMSAYTREGGHGPCHLKLALGWQEDFLFELIQPISGNVQHYVDYLPVDPKDPSLRLHHLGMLIMDDQEYERGRAAIDPDRVSYEGGIEGVKWYYLDARDTMGHYLEYMWATPDMLAMLRGV
jgi:hypothetical protein